MRKALITLSLLSLGVIGVGVCWILLNPAENFHLGMLTELIGIFIAFVDSFLFAIYTFRQHRAAKQYLKKKGITVESYQDIFQVKDQAAQPYKRDFLLQIIPFSSLALVLLSQPVLKLALPTRDFGGNLTTATVDVISLTCFLVLPLSLLIYAFLTKDLTK